VKYRWGRVVYVRPLVVDQHAWEAADLQKDLPDQHS
jgi:hypothetical protein